MKCLAICLVISMVLLLSLAGAEAASQNNVVRLSFMVIGSISLDLDESALFSKSDSLEAEAFSEIKERDIGVDKLTRDRKSLWLFTKTE